MVNRVFQWFEQRLDSYPGGDPVEPPKGLLAFCLHYSSGAKKWLALMAFTAATIASFEIVTFGFVGSLVDWLSTADRATFMQTEGPKLYLMLAFVVLVVPAVGLLGSLNVHQGLLGNFPQRIRWMA